MKRPNLVNPQNWTPFRSIPEFPLSQPLSQSFPLSQSLSSQLPPLPQFPPPTPVPQLPPSQSLQFSRKELLQKNSFRLNLFCLIVILGISYFLYSIYLERKVFVEYLEYIKNVQEEHYPGFL